MLYRQFVLSLALGAMAAGMAQAAPITIYSEDFTGQAGEGFFAGTTDLSGVDWTLNTSEVDSGATFGVDGSESFVAINTELKGVFFTKEIDISGYTNVSYSVDVYNSGNIEAADYFDSRYRIDNGATVLVADFMGMGSPAHTLIGNTAPGGGVDFSPITVVQAIPEGDVLKLTFTIRNNFEVDRPIDEVIGFDNIRVWGDLQVPEPTGALLGGVALAGLAFNRRRQG